MSKFHSLLVSLGPKNQLFKETKGGFLLIQNGAVNSKKYMSLIILVYYGKLRMPFLIHSNEGTERTELNELRAYNFLQFQNIY